MSRQQDASNFFGIIQIYTKILAVKSCHTHTSDIPFKCADACHTSKLSSIVAIFLRACILQMHRMPPMLELPCLL